MMSLARTRARERDHFELLQNADDDATNGAVYRIVPD